MGFEKDSSELVACIKFLERIKPKKKDSDTINIINLVSLSDSPNKTTHAENNLTKEDAITTEELEKIHDQDETLTAPPTKMKDTETTRTSLTEAG